MNIRLAFSIFSTLLLMLACQRQKQPFFIQNPTLQANIKAQTDEFAQFIKAQQYREVIEKGEKVLVHYKDSLSYDSIGWAMLHHRLAVAYSRNTPQDSVFHKKMKAHFTSAILLRQGIASENSELANSYLNLGIGENEYEYYEDAIAPLKKALDFYTEKDTQRYISVRKELLRAYSALNENDLTEKYFKITEQYYNEINFPSTDIQKEYAGVLHYYGDFLKNIENYPKAIIYLTKAQQLFRKLGSENGEARVNLSLSFAQMENEQSTAAISTVNSTIPYFIAQKDGTNLGQAYFQSGNCYIAQKKYPKALLYSEQKALPILQMQQGSNVLGKCYQNISVAYFQNGNYQNALKNVQNALQSYIPDFKENDFSKNPNEQQLKKCQAKSELINVFLQKAETLSKFAIQTKSTTYLENSWQTYQVLDDLIAMIRKDILTENSKIDLGERQNWVGDALVVAKQLFAKTKNLKYQDEAYALVQNTKAQVINEHFQGEKGKMIANVSEADLTKERELFAECSELYKKQSDRPNDKNIAGKILLAEQHFYGFKKIIEQKYPLYYQRKYDHNTLEIKEIQNRIKENTAIIDYMVTGDSLHIFCINKQRLTWKTIAISKNQKADADTLRSLLNQTNSKIKTPQSKQFLDCSNRLYQTLIQPISSELLGIKRLRITPSDWLYKVSFESLCTTPYSGDWSDKTVPYLIRNYAISYLFSVKELPSTPKKEAKNKISVGSFGITYNDKAFSSLRSGDSCLAVMADTRGGGKLPHAAKEADSVYTLWGSGDCFLNEKATKENFIKNGQSNNYSILHLAIHGVPECNNPEKIQLVFAKNNADEDNLIRLHEIAGLKMHSDLAVISACHSGDGQLQNKEGIISLARAFSMAGCQSLITSNSYVIDDTSPMIFKYFYKNLKDNDLEKDIALQKAICSYLDDKTNTMRIPYRWANFHLWGDVDTVKGDEKTSFFPFNAWWIGLLVITGLGLWYLLKLRIRRRS